MSPFAHCVSASMGEGRGALFALAFLQVLGKLSICDNYLPHQATAYP